VHFNKYVFISSLILLQVNASDEDVGQNAEITYALADLQPTETQGQSQGQGQRRQIHTESSQLLARNDGGEDDIDASLCVEKFYIDSDTGVVTAKTPLDYEQRAIYRCRVLAVDAGEPPNTGQTPSALLCTVNLFLISFLHTMTSS